MSERMWGPVPDVREVEAHHERCGFTGNYSPWLMRSPETPHTTRGSDEEVKMVVRLVIYNSGTPRALLMAQVPTLFELKDSVHFSSEQRQIGELPDCEWCALSHDGTPMPRIDVAEDRGAATTLDAICGDFAARMRDRFPGCFVAHDGDVLHFYTGTRGADRYIPSEFATYPVQVHFGGAPRPATKGEGR